MARKVVNITNSASQYDILSQTPENYNPDNYFINQLQEKVNQEWIYRPNRTLIEYESVWGQDSWLPIEVVAQTVKSEKGTEISNDYRNIVFKNISEDRFKIGHKFRFSPRYDINADKKTKNVWLAVNTNSAKITSSMVISRCNGILGSIYQDAQGITQFHYEPVIQGRDLSSVGLSYNEVAVAPQSQLVITAQYNDYTNAYKINQRFIIGARQKDPDNDGHYIGGHVYRITAINKFYGNSTYNPEDVGLLKLYLELTETSPYDDWDNMIAYQQDSTVRIDTTTSTSLNLSIKFTTPETFPSVLGSDAVVFTPVVVDENGTELPQYSKLLEASYQLENWPSVIPESKQADYIAFVSPIPDHDYFSFSVQRKKLYTYGDLIVTCTLPSNSAVGGSEVTSSFNLVVRRQK